MYISLKLCYQIQLIIALFSNFMPDYLYYNSSF